MVLNNSNWILTPASKISSSLSSSSVDSLGAVGALYAAAVYEEAGASGAPYELVCESLECAL